MRFSAPDTKWNKDPDAALAELEARLEQDGRFYGGTGQFRALKQLPRNIDLLQTDQINLQYTQVDDLSGLANIPHLKRVQVGEAVTDISGVEDLPNLTRFEMPTGKWTIRDLSPLGRCKHLKEVKIYPTPETDLAFFDGKPLKSFELTADCSYHLPNLPQLKWLSINVFGDGEIEEFELSTIGSLDQLDYLCCSSKRLRVRGLPHTMEVLRWAAVDLCEAEEFDVFSNCRALEYLRVCHPDIDNVRPVAHCPKLRDFRVINASIQDVSSLRSHPSLEDVDISGNPVSDITPLSFSETLLDLKARETLVTSLVGWNKSKRLGTLDLGNTRVHDISPLFGASISTLSLNGTLLSDLTGVTKIKSIRRLNISGTDVAEVPASEIHAELFHEPPYHDPRDGPAFYYENTPLKDRGFKLL